MPGHGEHQLVLDLVHRIGEVADRLRFIVEGDHEEFILRIRRLEELDHRVFRALHLAGHASAGIEDHSQRDRSVLGGERSDLLRRIAFEKLEIRLVQAGHQPVHGIGNRHRDQHQIYVDFQRTHLRSQRGRRGHELRLRSLRWLIHFARQNVHVIHAGLPDCGNVKARQYKDGQGKPEPQPVRGRVIFARLGSGRVPGKNQTATSNSGHPVR